MVISLLPRHQPRVAPLIATHDREAFVSAPIGRCFVGPTYVIWCFASDLQGAIVWGSLDDRSIRDMMSIGEFIHHPQIAERRRALTDCRDVERADADVLLGFAAIARERITGWAAGLERQALIIPPGSGGMLLAGAMSSVGVDHPLRTAPDLHTALAFVDHPAAATAHASAAAIAAAARGESVLLSRLRAHFVRDLSAATIETSAAALGMSTRTLQRELHKLETSFSNQLRRVRIENAEALLVHTDVKIDAIAAKVGFGTGSRMSALLRRAMNRTSSQLRAERRGAATASTEHRRAAESGNIA